MWKHFEIKKCNGGVKYLFMIITVLIIPEMLTSRLICKSQELEAFNLELLFYPYNPFF